GNQCPFVVIDTLLTNHLIVFVPFAGKQYNVVGLRLCDDLAHRIFTPHDDLYTLARGHTGDNILHNLLRWLSTRVIIGHHYTVSHIGGHSTHLWALPSIAVTTTAKHAP